MGRTRGTWNTKGVWVTGGLAAAVLLLTGYVMFTGDDGGTGAAGKGGASPGVSSSASSTATYAAPEDWTEPVRWAALPRGERRDSRGSEVGYPQSAEGAAAMAAAANTTGVDAQRSTVDEQLRLYYSYVGKTDQTSDNAETIELSALQTDKTLHRAMGVSAGQPLPVGAYVRSTVVGYKVIKATSGEVSLWLLARVTQKTGETAKESGSYTRTLAGTQWQDGDWKLTGQATQRAQQAVQGQTEPTMAAPGDEAFNAAGWTAIREAS